MRSILTFFFLSTISLLVQGQAPQFINYQAVIRDNSGSVIENQNVGLRISIQQNSTTVYQETHTATTNDFGLANISIGNGNPTQGTFSSIDWPNGPFFAQIELDVTGSTNYQLMGSQQLMSVPYALYAENAGNVDGGFSHYVGEEFGGGVIFHLWIDANGTEHGLIVDKADLSTAQVWSNVNQTEVGSAAQSSWDGHNNSSSVINQPGHTGSAASLCLNSLNSGYNDWYLPSVDELGLLWHNRFDVNRSLSTIIGSTQLPNNNAVYWSSTEFSAMYAYLFYFYGGDAGTPNKTVSARVRAIRSF